MITTKKRKKKIFLPKNLEKTQVENIYVTALLCGLKNKLNTNELTY